MVSRASPLLQRTLMRGLSTSSLYVFALIVPHSSTDGAPPRGSRSCRQCLCCVLTVNNNLSILCSQPAALSSSSSPNLAFTLPSVCSSGHILLPQHYKHSAIISSSAVYLFHRCASLFLHLIVLLFFCGNLSLSILFLQSPVDSDNEYKVLLPRSRFLCE